jgi:hypothetical protein
VTYDFKAGDEVYVSRWHGGSIQRVEKISRGFAVVGGKNYRMSGNQVKADGFGYASIEPATDEHRLLIRRAAAVARVSGIRGNEWAALPVERLEAIIAEVAAAKAGGT